MFLFKFHLCTLAHVFVVFNGAFSASNGDSVIQLILAPLYTYPPAQQFCAENYPPSANPQKRAGEERRTLHIRQASSSGYPLNELYQKLQAEPSPIAAEFCYLAAEHIATTTTQSTASSSTSTATTSTGIPSTILTSTTTSSTTTTTSSAASAPTGNIGFTILNGRTEQTYWSNYDGPYLSTQDYLVSGDLGGPENSYQYAYLADDQSFQVVYAPLASSGERYLYYDPIYGSLSPGGDNKISYVVISSVDNAATQNIQKITCQLLPGQDPSDLVCAWGSTDIADLWFCNGDFALVLSGYDASRSCDTSTSGMLDAAPWNTPAQ